MEKVQQVKCIYCGSLSPTTNVQCWKCGKKLEESKKAKPSKNEPEDTCPELENALTNGAIIVSKGDGYVTVRYPKKFSWWTFILLVLLMFILIGFVLLLIYLIYYAASSPKEETFKLPKSNKKQSTERVVVKCPKCGTKNEEDADFCKKCANKL